MSETPQRSTPEEVVRIVQRCGHCENIATCFGEYEANTGQVSFACDQCCGHGCEDGWCKPVGDFIEWAASLSATHEALVAALERYGRHDIDCELYVCKVCRRRADDEQHYIGTVDSHVFQGPNACDCGFSKALNESR